MRSLRALARIPPTRGRPRFSEQQKRTYSMSNRDLYGAQMPQPRVATLEREAQASKEVVTEAPERPRVASVVPLKERSVEDRLNDPNLLFEGEDEVPDAHINMIKGSRPYFSSAKLDAEFRYLADQAEEALKLPDVQLFERVCHARTRMLELRWLADPDPPSAMNRMKLENDIQQMLIDTEAEFDEYLEKKYQGSTERDQAAAEAIMKRWEKDGRKAEAAEGALGKRLKPFAKRLKKKAKEIMKKKKEQDSEPLYQSYDKMETHRKLLPEERANVGATASVDKILAHKKMKSVEKRRAELAAQGQTFADIAPEGITVEAFAKVQRAADLGRSPLDTEDLGLDNEESDYEIVESVDPKTGKKKLEKKLRSVIEIKEDDMTDMDDEAGLQEDIEEAMRMVENDAIAAKKSPYGGGARGGPGPRHSLFEAEPGESDPAIAALKRIQKAKVSMEQRRNEWQGIEVRRKQRLEEARAYTDEVNRTSQ